MTDDSHSYSRNVHDTEENDNRDDKYSQTGESEFSRVISTPFDENEVLSVRHYNMGPLFHGRERVRVRRNRGQDFRGRGPKGYRKSDEAIREDVSEALYRSTEVDASEIEVTVKDSLVTLKGSVVDRFQKKMAEAAVEHIAGVEDVYNELHVRSRASRLHEGVVSPQGLLQNTSGMN